MKKILLDNKEYEVVENVNDCLNLEELSSLYTDYFNDFDYLLGDYAYDKLRLKGFCDKDNKRYKEINDITKKDEYLNKQCAYNCKYFLLKRVKSA